VCEISCKNSEQLLRKWQKTLGDTFLPHTVQAEYSQVLCPNSQIFVTMATWDKTSRPRNFENPQFGTRIWDISYTSRVIANFMFKYPKFYYYGNTNRDPSEISCNDTIKLADPENPSLVQKSRNCISYRNRVIANRLYTAVRP